MIITRIMFSTISGTIAMLLYGINTVFWFVPIILLSLVKLLPITPLQTVLSYLLDGCATAWVTLNTLNQNVFSRSHWDVQGVDNLSSKDWYLVISNHQSWVDILVLQRIFNRKVPFLKFFLKKELLYVPVLGLAWWALDFPFMRRYSKAFLEKHPHLKGKDLETTRKACAKFANKPVSIMNFVEGTRATAAKRHKQGNPYNHLLNPRAGGIAFVLSAMGNRLHKLLDVTICYPQGVPSFWDFVCGKVSDIKVRVQVINLEELALADYFAGPEQKREFQVWLNDLWTEKDLTIDTLATGR